MTDRSGSPRLCLALWSIGAVAALSLLAAPVETLVPAHLGLSWWQVRALALVNPLLLLSVAVAVGCALGGRVGLDAPVFRALIERRPAASVLRRQVGPAILVGVVTAAVLGLYAVFTAPIFAAAPKLPDLALPLATKLLYGGVVEELMMRWGLMSLLVWVAWKVSRAPVAAPGAFVIGIMGAALVFAVGHLPMVYAILPQPPAALIAAVIVGNALPGALFGWLFWKRGLEAAILAHALGHLIFTVAGSLVA